MNKFPYLVRLVSLEYTYTRRSAIRTTCEIKNGYAVICDNAAEINVDFDMPVSAVRANRSVHEDAGRVAIVRGPVVYCAEGVDNGKDLKSVRVDINGDFKPAASEFLLPSIHTTAYQQPQSESLYRPAADDWNKIPFTLIPYYAFANRGTTEMCVWLLEK